MSGKPAIPALLTLFLCAASLTPLPAVIRIPIALSAILFSFPLASPELWRAGEDRAPLVATVVRIAGLIVASALPITLVTGLGLLGVPVSVLAPATIGLAGAMAALTLLRSRGGDASAIRGHHAVAPASSGAVLLAAAAGCVFLFGLHGTPVGIADDSFDHLATLRHMIATDRIDFPGAFYAVDPPEGQDPRKGVVLTALALTARLTGADLLEVWRHSALVLPPILMLAWTSLALALFRRVLPALAASVALLLLWGDPFWLLRGAYGGHWGLGAAWAGTALLLSGGGFGWGFIAGAATAAIHAYAPFQLLVPLVLLRVGGFLLGKREGFPSGASILGVIAGALPLEIARKLLAGPVSNTLHAQSTSWLLTPWGPVISPLQLLGWLGYPGAAALGVLLVLLIVRRDRTGAFLAATAAAPLLLVANPWLYSRVGTMIGSVGNKLVLAWAYPLLAGWITALLLGPARKREKVAAAAGAMVLVAAAFPATPARLEALLRGPSPLPDDLVAAARVITSQAGPGEAVASDPLTSYAVPALTGRPVIVTLHQHAPPGDGRAPERIEIASELFSDCVPVEDAVRQAREEGAAWLLVARAPGWRIDHYGLHKDPRNDARLLARFAGRPDILGLVHQDPASGFDLYRILPGPLPPEGESGNAAPGGEATTGAAASPTALSMTSPLGPTGSEGPTVSDGAVSVHVQLLPLHVVSRGDRLRIPAAWRLDKPATGYLEYTGHIRFENEALPATGSFMSLISKPLRRIILERRAGGSYRWRAVEMPFLGLCPPAAWPVGEWLPDTLDIRVPDQLLPGRYTLRLGLERGTLYPVHTMADLFQDVDRYSGPVAGTLEVR